MLQKKQLIHDEQFSLVSVPLFLHWLFYVLTFISSVGVAGWEAIVYKSPSET
jgi:hypothetical protein